MKPRKHWLSAFSGMLLALASVVEARPLIIGGIPDEPLRYQDETQTLKGIDVEIFETVMKDLGIEYQIQLVDASPRLDIGWQSPQPAYDMVFTYSQKEERLKYLAYAEESHVEISWSFFILKENQERIKFEKLEDLKGLKIGVTKGFSYSPEFLEAGKSLLIFDEVTQNELQIKKLLIGRIDTTPLNTITALYEAQKGGYQDKITYLKKPLVSKAYYNTFVKASDYPGLMDLIPKYDEKIRKMKADGTLKAIFAKYGGWPQ